MRKTLLNNSSRTNSKMYIRDWRQALRSPPTYRLGNRTFRFHFHIALIMLAFGSLIVIFLYVKPSSQSQYSNSWLTKNIVMDEYNYTYPLTTPVIINGIRTYRIGLIADLDTESKSKTDPNVWTSYYKKGYLSYYPTKEKISIAWDTNEPIKMYSSYSLKGRGMELSELIVFDGRLLTFDDRTGIIYEIINDKVIPWVILTDGDGHTMKGFKSEWATVKNKLLYVGSMGKEWTTSHGQFENENPMYIVTVTKTGEVQHKNWVNNFKGIREVLGITWPGYMIHESGMWSEKLQKWYFLPRRCSKERYNETRDEFMGCNALIKSDDKFMDIKSIKIGQLKPTHGYSSFKFIPGTDDEIIIALATEEVNGRTSTFISGFTIDGKILLDEEIVSENIKYEGLEFI